MQLISKIVTALTLYFGAHLVIDGKLTVGELVAFNMLAGRVAQPVLRLAQIWQDFQQARISVAAARRHPERGARADLSARPRRAAARSRARSPSTTSPSAIGSTAPEVLQDVSARRFRRAR